MDYSPQQKLENLRSALNERMKERKKVQTVEIRLLAGAKRAAGKQQEAQQIRPERWLHEKSRLWLDITSHLTGNAVDDEHFPVTSRCD